MIASVTSDECPMCLGEVAGSWQTDKPVCAECDDTLLINNPEI